MPITTQSTYPATMQLFLQHWTLVNAALSPAVLKLQGGYAQTNFAADRAAIVTAFTSVNAQLVTLNLNRNQAFAARKALILRVEQFRKFVRANFKGTTYYKGLPATPKVTEIDTRFLRPIEQIQSLWSMINIAPPTGFTPPLKLQGGYDITAFSTDVTAIRALFTTFENQKLTYSNAISARNALLRPAVERMVQYRAAVKATLLPADPLYASVPRVYPVAGSTPQTVTDLLFVYKPSDNTVKLTFTPSVSKNISDYQLLYSPGAKWDSGNTQTIATLPATGPFAFNFTLSMVDPEAVGLFKVYVMNDTGNVRGSKMIRIKRTAALTLNTLTTTSEALPLAA